MTKLHELAVAGQSIWLDYIRRSFLDAGELGELAEKGLRGVTSNPSIFQKAISAGTDYDAAIERLVDEGKTIHDIYESLAIQDIRRACDILRPVYERTDGKDGFVSLEVNPKLAYDTEGTVEEARRLFSLVDRPNVMIKVPATAQGIPAIETLIGEGVNVNVTLMFSLQHYEETANAYIRGLERLADTHVDYSRVASVASFFVSRVDGKVDPLLEEEGNEDLKGKIAIANAKMAYHRFTELFSGPRWERLAEQGARVQRPLWGSTSTKDPEYSKTLYVDELIGPDTVNTLPPETLEEFIQSGTVARTVDQNLDEAREQLEQLESLGIDLDEITTTLQSEGVKSFADSFDDLMEGIEKKVAKLTGSSDHGVSERLDFHLGSWQEQVDEALAEMDEEQVVPRIWAHSHSVWSSEPDEITNRLGWLRIVDTMLSERRCIEALAQDLQKDTFSRAVVLGMGGSSLAPEVFGKLFHSSNIQVTVLDSTHPDVVTSLSEELTPEETLFIVSTKSGTTTETLSFFRHFYNWVQDAVGEEKVGEHFVAITDPGSKLVTLADAHSFRATFINDPDIGGRYSALSYFGLVPACLAGADLNRLLRRASEAMNACGAHVTASRNPGARIGAVMGELAKAGRDKLTVLASDKVDGFGDWLEQLVAESMGKSGTGILPVVGEAAGVDEAYGDDRLFVVLQWSDDDTLEEKAGDLRKAGHPTIQVRFRDPYDLGEQFFLWEFAVAVAGSRLGIHPFDQPNVESAKNQARKMMSSYMDTGRLPELSPSLTQGEVRIYGEGEPESPADALTSFVDQGEEGDYISLHAYLNPTREIEEALRSLQEHLRDRTGLATTLGYGPRFLHSTGQLHKGDGGNGLFIQFTDRPQTEVIIPDRAGKPEATVPFSILIESQSLGDRQALLDENRRVLRIDLGSAPADLLRLLDDAVTPVAQE